MIKRFLVLGVLLITFLAAPAMADEPGDGTLQGQVVNGTVNGTSVANTEIVLRVFQAGVELHPAITTADADGQFEFTGLQTTLDYWYYVSVNFQEVDYQTQPLVFTEDSPILETTITVYDTTTSDESVSVVLAHSVLHKEEASILVSDYYLFANNSDRTYIGPNGTASSGTLDFYLPRRAEDFQITLGLTDGRIVESDSGFRHGMPVLPGMFEVAYSYRIGYNSDTYTLSSVIYYPTSRYDLLISGGELQATSPQLASDESLEIEGVVYRHLSRETLMPGETLDIEISAGGSGIGSGLWILLLGIALAAGVIVGIIWMRKRSPRLQVIESGTGGQKELLSELAALDDDFEAGAINEAEYNRLRAEKKAVLLELMRKSRRE